jgi:hypothetical protein
MQQSGRLRLCEDSVQGMGGCGSDPGAQGAHQYLFTRCSWHRAAEDEGTHVSVQRIAT